MVESGLFSKPGAFGNLPAGEVAVAPVEDTAEGVLVIDGSLALLGVVKEPITLAFHKGTVTEITGGKEALELKKYLKNLDDPNAYRLAELGIGINEKARIIGNLLEDEKALRTAHCAIGSNSTVGGKIISKTHIDGIILDPTLEVNGKTILSKGTVAV
jgi:leucyl aminopeptidase (aminopeptidase T)